MPQQHNCTTDYWKDQMLRGNFEAAWKFSDQVLEERKGKSCWHLPRHQQYVWNGTPLHNKRVLIRCYHGLGDTLMFIRFAPLVKKIAKEVIVWAQPELLALLQSAEGIDQLLPLHEGNPEVTYDVDVEVMELAHIFRITPSTIPRHIPYLHTPPLYLPCATGRPSIGLFWKVGNFNESRSIPFTALLPLFNIDEVNFYILQSNPKEAGWSEDYGIYPGAFDLYHFARIVKGLDLVITPDSMPAHIAGAQGVPAWTLLEKYCDWRWMSSGNSSPWYPGMRLFRQRIDGDWYGVIDEVAGALKEFARSRKLQLQ